MEQKIQYECEVIGLRMYALSLGVNEAILLHTKEEILEAINLKLESIIDRNIVVDWEYTQLCEYAEEIGAYISHCQINDKGCVRSSIKQQLINIINLADTYRLNYNDYIHNIKELNLKLEEEYNKILSIIEQENNQTYNQNLNRDLGL